MEPRASRRHREIWADYDNSSIVIYQAYSHPIADAALQANRFVPPFSFTRMTWIKPSFLWLMVRSGWGRKPGQTRILAVRISRASWETALAKGVLTHPDRAVYADETAWRARFGRAEIHVQWDPERSLRGNKLEHRSIQVGVGRQLVRKYAEEWVLEIRDLTQTAHTIRQHLSRGDARRARRLLPAERRYPIPERVARVIGAS